MAVSLQALREKLSQKSSTTKQKSIQELLWKPTQLGENTVRIVPFEMDDNGNYLDDRLDKEMYPFIKMKEWKSGFGTGIPSQPNYKKIAGKENPYEDSFNKRRMSIYAEAKNPKNADLSDRLKLIAKKLVDVDRYYCLLIDRDDDTQTPRFWEVSNDRVLAILDAIEADELARKKEVLIDLLLNQDLVTLTDKQSKTIKVNIEDCTSFDKVLEEFETFKKKLKLPDNFGHDVDLEEGNFDRFDLEDGRDLKVVTTKGTFKNQSNGKVYDTKEIQSITCSKKVKSAFDDEEEMREFYEKAPSVHDDLYVQLDDAKAEEILDIFVDSELGSSSIESSPKASTKKKVEAVFEDDDDDEDEPEVKPKKSTSPAPKTPTPPTKRAFVEDDDDDDDLSLPF